MSRKPLFLGGEIIFRRWASKVMQCFQCWQQQLAKYTGHISFYPRTSSVPYRKTCHTYSTIEKYSAFGWQGKYHKSTALMKISIWTQISYRNSYKTFGFLKNFYKKIHCLKVAHEPYRLFLKALDICRVWILNFVSVPHWDTSFSIPTGNPISHF
jgi:hypothetical protein